MVLSSRLTSNKRAFLNYNRYKHRIMYENDAVRAGLVLKLIPLLLHLNHPGLPGYSEKEDCPCGIKIMERPIDSKMEILSMIPEKISLKSIQESMPRVREIEGIFTIGSLGSVGETKDSDCDIWVVVDAGQIDTFRMKLLEKKLGTISKWASGLYNMEVYFFLLDINDIKNNNFGAISQEGAGSSLKSLLKEEFYRTMTLIEGRIPVWWIIPVTEDKDAYNVTVNNLSSIEGSSPDDFIDLGDLGEIPRDELLGAALWQMHKALSDPLKSVLKMAQVRMHLETKGSAKLFCNNLKMKIHDARHEDIIDPYIEAFKSIERHYSQEGYSHTADLMRKCMYLKSSPGIKPIHLLAIEKNEKQALISDLVREWGWSLKTIEHLNDFPDWNIKTYKLFGHHIHEFLSGSAMALLKDARSADSKANIYQDLEIEVLRRRIESVYVKKEDKIESEKRIQKKENAYDDLYFGYTGGIWEVFNNPDYSDKTGVISSARRISSVIAWLVLNRRFSSTTSCHMLPNPTSVYLSDVQTLMRDLMKIIPDASTIGLDRDSLLKRMSVNLVIFIGNLEQPLSTSIKEIDVIALNTWSELYCMQMDKEELKIWFNNVTSKDTKINLWLPGSGDSKSLAKELMSIISKR
jgi:adenylate cyclase, class 1